MATGNASITNASSIGGGLGGDGSTRANAIDLSGGNNRLTLVAGYSFTGNVVSTSGVANGAGQNWSIADGTLQGDANTFAGNISFAPAPPTSTPGVVFDQGSGNANSAVSATYAGTVSGAGSLTKIGDGTLTLSGANTYTGATTVNAGILRAGIATNAFGSGSALTVNSGTTLDLNSLDQTVGSLAGSGSLTLGSGTLTSGGNNTSTTFSGPISGSGGLNKAGTGALTLSGTNGYTGATTVTAGTLRAGIADNAFGNGSAVTVNSNATLDLNNFNQTVGSLAGSGSLTLGSGTLTSGGNNSSTTFSGLISGSGGLNKTGTGTWTLSGDNSAYIGSTTVSAGTLLLGHAAALGGAGAIATVDADATLDLGGQGIGTSVNLRGGTLSNSTGDGVLTGALDLGTGAVNTISSNSGTSLTLSGAISGDGVTIAGSGSVNYRGTNTYTGTTTIHAGATLTTEAAGVGAGNGIANNGTLILDQQAGSGTVSQAISGSGSVTKSGFGTTVTLTGANTYAGATTISEGTLQAGAVNTFSAASAVTIDIGTLDLNNYSQTIGSLSGYGFVTLGTSGTGILTVGADNSSTLYQGYISGSGGLTKVGTGTLTLARDNDSYTGVTTINAGTLRLDNANGPTGLGASTATVIVNSGGTLDVNGQYGVVQSIDLNGGTLANGNSLGPTSVPLSRVFSDIHLTQGGTNTISSDGYLTLSGVISGDSVTIAGTNRVIYGAANTYTGTTTINAGAILETDAAGVGSGSGIINNGTLAFDQSGPGTVRQAIDGSGHLTKWGSGTLTLSGANSYSGGTSVYEGMLSVSEDRNLGAVSAPLILDDGTLRNTAAFTIARAIGIGYFRGTFQTDADLTITGRILGADAWGDGGLFKTGAGTLTLTGANTYAGGTNVREGTLSVSRDENLGNATGDLTLDGGTLRTTGAFDTARTINLEGNGGTLQTDADLTASGTVRGDGTLVKAGTGTLTLTGTNRYRGGTQIDAGTLAVSADANLGRASGALSFNGGTLRTTGAFTTARSIVLDAGGGTLQTDADLTASGIVSGVGALAKTGAGTLTLTGENTYSGGTDLKEGRIAVRNNRALGSGELAMHEGTTLRF
ncbi:beta strand repeat-containing protein, partial [Variovorax sp. JS1663]|uniref:beta strand repeat-containing protein n=1 Tax=Variovorax sp. JS1663 TaxID=1851577 RepID=UPI0018640EAD